ncbi:MAG: tandem-95 repeat protein, partial [candidate division Zixibacteria bacterium]|nr:tandem-95 repeat protein [candidate division Zixibacteria bacterium]
MSIGKYIQFAAVALIFIVSAVPVMAQTAPPVLDPIGAQTVAEGGTLNLTVTATDADATIPTLTTSTLPTNAGFVDNGDGTGSFSFSPDYTQAGDHSVTFYATDAVTTTDVDSEIVVITVTNTNQTPVVSDIPGQTIAEGGTFTTITLDDYVTDVDNTDAEMTWSYSGNTSLTVSITDRVATITTPSADWNGAETITFRATDPGSLFAEDAATFTVTAVNDAPVLATIGAQSVAEGAHLNFNATASDVDGTTPTLSAVDVPTNATFVNNGDGTGTFNFDPDYTQAGGYDVTFIATDGVLADTEIVTITVTDGGNQAPVVSDIPDQTIAEGGTFTTITLDDYVTDADNTAAEMTWSYSGNTSLTVSITDRVATITTPDADWNGAETITFRATDPGSLFAEDAATFTVTATNDAPVVSDIPDQTIAEGATFATINLDDYVTDADNTPAEMTWTYSGNTALTVSIIGRVATIATPTADWNGAETITFRATDPGLAFAENAAVFTVTNINDAPVASDIPDQTIAEGETFTTITLDDYVTDVDNTAAEMTWTYSGNTSLTVSITDRVATITTPDADWNGAETITFRATDPGSLFAEDAATFTVTATNDAPVVSDIPDQTIAEGGTFTTITLDDYVTDADNTAAEMTWTYSGNTSLTVSIVDRVATITTPTADWNGAETITFRATDPGSLFAEDAATFTVTAVNDAPVLTAIGPQAVAEGANLNFNATATDVDGTTPTLSAVDVPANATFVNNGDGTGTFNFDPDYTQAGGYDVTFIATDGVLADTEIVTITVTDGGNQAPVVSDIPDQTIAEGGPFATITLDDYVTDADNTDAE